MHRPQIAAWINIGIGLIANLIQIGTFLAGLLTFRGSGMSIPPLGAIYYVIPAGVLIYGWLAASYLLSARRMNASLPVSSQTGLIALSTIHRVANHAVQAVGVAITPLMGFWWYILLVPHLPIGTDALATLLLVIATTLGMQLAIGAALQLLLRSLLPLVYADLAISWKQ